MHHSQLSKIPDGFNIKRVPIGVLSDSIFTPDLPLRPTQPTIGYYLEETKPVAEDSYGVHRSKYGGTGETKIQIGNYEMFTPRRTNSFKTAVHCSSSQPPMTDKARAMMILRNQQFFAAPINEVACDVFRLTTESKPFPLPAQKQIFPRSVVYEIEYAKEQYRKEMSKALEKERKEFEEIIMLQKNFLQHKRTEETKLSGNEQVETALPEKDKTSEKEKNYIQNTIEQNEVENLKGNSDALPCTSVCGLCGCTLSRGACTKCNTEKESLNLETIFDKANDKWKPEPPRFITPWGEQRTAEMMKVRYPFKTEAVRWYYKSFLNPDTPENVPSKTSFPEYKFSSVNI